MDRVQKIMLERAEGYAHECNKPVKVNTWDEANTVLRAWSHTAPKDGSYYHKCDIWVKSDGSTLKGRYDLVHWSVEPVDAQSTQFYTLTGEE